jgi:hypothetical protein
VVGWFKYLLTRVAKVGKFTHFSHCCLINGSASERPEGSSVVSRLLEKRTAVLVVDLLRLEPTRNAESRSL